MTKLAAVIQGCGSRYLVLVSRPIKTTFLRSWPCWSWSWSWSWPPWSWSRSRRVVLSKTWGYVQPQRYFCPKSKLASECAPLFTYLLFDRPISMFLCIITFTAVQCSNVDEWKLFMCAGRDQDSKGLGLGLGCWSWSRPCWSWSWSRPPWSWSRSRPVWSWSWSRTPWSWYHLCRNLAHGVLELTGTALMVWCHRALWVVLLLVTDFLNNHQESRIIQLPVILRLCSWF